MSARPFALFHDDPAHARPLLAELTRRGVPVVHLDPLAHAFDPAERRSAVGLVFNRVGPDTFRRPAGLAFAAAFLEHFERLEIPVVNGSLAFAHETSRAKLFTLLDSLGLPHPRARVVIDRSQLAAAADGLRFPVAVRSNAGGPAVRFETPADLAVGAVAIDLGADPTAVVEEAAPAGAAVTRVELLGGKVQYAVQRVGGAVARVTPPDDVLDACAEIVQAAGLDVGGVEYHTDDRDGRVVYTAAAALPSVPFPTPADLGFDPVARVVDFLERAARVGVAHRPPRRIRLFSPDAEYWDAAL